MSSKLSHTKSKLIFLDRDGVINKLRKDYVKELDEFEFLPHIGVQLARLNKAGFKIVIVTNQSAVGRGLISKTDLEKIHSFLISSLAKDGCMIERIYYCPHTPEENCSCRKPETGMLEKAIEEFSPVDLNRSFLIGDDNSDIEAANKIKISSFKIQPNTNIKKVIDKILSNV